MSDRKLDDVADREFHNMPKKWQDEWADLRQRVYKR